ncbi:MAG: hypothetical protein KBC60_01430 [Haliscomenobacter sp.]|nr:hypothetical protein [Haliscomenobacter sp.]
MYELEQEYLEELEALAGEIQESEDLAKYLESEEEEDYNRLKEAFEPQIGLLYNRVAAENPLQIIPFELVLLDPAFEGLFLPKILGYAVLRGELNDQYHYVRSQEHFKEVLMAICNSTNFEILKQRIGQSIQIGFALSSDIWITNLINSIPNKRIRYFLQSQVLEKFRRLPERANGYQRYNNQFRNDNFQTAEFPETATELPVFFSSLKNFLLYRASIKADNASLVVPVASFVENKEFQGTKEHLQIMMIYAMYFEKGSEERQALAAVFQQVRSSMPNFTAAFLEFLLELHHLPDPMELGPAQDNRMSELADKSYPDELSAYYKLTDAIHQQGYIQPEVQEAVKVFYNQHEGLSSINECLRLTIRHYFEQFIRHLEESAYPDYIEICKLFPVYMGIFVNQQFNQDLKELSMDYLQRMLVYYTDKRGKDYQDIKRFVSSAFQEFGFLKEKELVEIFKTRRKKKSE